MRERCPNCGAPRRAGMVNRYECGSSFIPGWGLKHESKQCLRNQNEQMRKQIAALETKEGKP